MHRTLRAVAVVLLAMFVALPVAGLPSRERTPPPRPDLVAALWARLAPILGVFDTSRAGADPDGLPTPAPPPAEGSSTTQAPDGDSRSSADPDG